MSIKILKLKSSFFVLFLFSMLLFFMILPPAGIQAQTDAQANGFVFSKEDTMTYMYRFSFDNPGELLDRKLRDKEPRPFHNGTHYTFANRPWLYYLQWWRGGSFFVCTVDTATGKGKSIDMLYFIPWEYCGLSYDKKSNSLYIMCYRLIEQRRPQVEASLKRISLSGRGSMPDDVVTLKDTTTPVSFTIGSDGFGYSVNTEGRLSKINLTTGTVDVIGSVKINGKKIKNKITHSDFNPVNGKLYLLAAPDSLHTELVEVDVKTAKGKIAAKWNNAYSSLAISGEVYPPPLPAPELISPLGKLNTLEPLLQWKPVEGAEGYFVNYRIMDDGVDHPWWKWKDVKENSYQMEKGGFTSSSENYWWVAAYDSTGLGYFSKSGPVNDRNDELYK